jgi:hypothetical protein
MFLSERAADRMRNEFMTHHFEGDFSAPCELGEK